MSKKETDISPSKKKIIKKRNTTLEGFLSQFIIKKGADVEASHTSMGPPFGKYYIPDEKLSKFHNVYHHHVFDHKKDCHLVERHQNVGPIVIDLDFKYKTSDTLPDRRYTVSMIKGFLQLFFKEMSNILILEQD